MKIGFQDQLLLNAGQKYCRMLQGEHSAILLTFFKLPIVIKIFVLSIFEGPFYTGFNVCDVVVFFTCYCQSKIGKSIPVYVCNITLRLLFTIHL